MWTDSIMKLYKEICKDILVPQCCRRNFLTKYQLWSKNGPIKYNSEWHIHNHIKRRDKSLFINFVTHSHKSIF